MAIKYSFTMPNKEIENAIPKVAKDIQSTRKRAHLILCSILYRWHKGGDAKTAAERATSAVAEFDDYWSQAIVNWFGEFAYFEWDVEREAFSYTHTKIDLKQVQAARKKHFSQSAPAKAPQPFDLDDRIKNLINLAERRKTSKNKMDEDNIPDEHLDALRKLIA